MEYQVELTELREVRVTKWVNADNPTQAKERALANEWVMEDETRSSRVLETKVTQVVKAQW
jgi:hypothetical protein